MHQVRRMTLPDTNSRSTMSADEYSALINLAGRQRMLSQRVILHVVLAAYGDYQALVVARQALDLFRASHEALSAGASGDMLGSILAGPQNAGSAIFEFIDRLEAAVRAAQTEDASLKRLLPDIVRSATPMLELLDGITQHCENCARQEALSERKRNMSLLDRIQSIAREARIVSFNARVIAARAGAQGGEFAVVANVMTRISEEVESLARSAMTARP
jgi:hypothetical protein